MDILILKHERSGLCHLKHIFLLAFSNLFFVLSLSAQGLTSNTNMIVNDGALIHINGGLTVQAPFLLDGFLNLSGDFTDDNGVTSEKGKLIFNGNGGFQNIDGSALTVLHHLEIGESTEVHLHPAKQVTVEGAIINKNPVGGFVLRSDENELASLIHQTPSIQGTVERHFLYAAGSFHTISSPVNNQSIEPEFFRPGDIFYAWYEPLYSYVSFDNTQDFPTFLDANQNVETFLSAAGYFVYYNNQDEGMNTRRFEGPLHQGEISFLLSRKAHDHDPWAGYNVLGNPYPSAIDWLAEEGWSGKEHLVGSKTGVAWRWNCEKQNFGVIHPVARTKDHNRVSQFIPATAGFFIQVASGSDGELITMDDRVRVHYKNESLKDDNEEQQKDVVRLKVDCLQNGFSDEVILEYGHNSLMTAPKIPSPNPESPQVYVEMDEQKHSMLLLTDEQKEEIYPVHIRTPDSGLFSLSLTVDGFSPLVEIVNSQSGKQVLPFGEEPFVFDGSDSSFLEITVSHSP